MEYYSAIKKNEILSFVARQMNLETVILSEASQTQKEKYSIILLICRILNIGANEHIYKTDKDSQI